MNEQALVPVAVERPKPAQILGVSYEGILLYEMGIVLPFILLKSFWLLLLVVPVHLWMRRVERRNPWWAVDFLAEAKKKRADREPRVKG